MLAPPTLDLNDGASIPQLGFGVFQVPPDQVVGPVRTTIEAGYRLVDTAAAYGNEEGVGRAIAESGVAREELFITTKLWNGDHGREKAHAAFNTSLDRLGLDYVDLYLIHWPVPKLDRYIETWEALGELRADGRARSIGVSNFGVDHLGRIIEETGVTPAVNQIELHPWFPQDELRAFHAHHGIVTEAWSPIGQSKGILDDPIVGAVAAAHGRSAAQVVLRWHIQLGNVAIPKSVHAERIRENIAVFDFELSGEEIARISSLASGRRLGPDPEVFGIP